MPVGLIDLGKVLEFDGSFLPLAGETWTACHLPICIDRTYILIGVLLPNFIFWECIPPKGPSPLGVS